VFPRESGNANGGRYLGAVLGVLGVPGVLAPSDPHAVRHPESLNSPGEHSDKCREGLLEGLRRDIDRARDDDRAGFLRGDIRS
jgi:hypothetical protein